MHEYGIAAAILEAVERCAAGRPVRRARVRAGVLLRISEPALSQAFIMISDGTVADGAHLELTIDPVRLACRSCGRTSTSDDLRAACPGCGGTDVEAEGGDGLTLESIQPVEKAGIPWRRPGT
jgi:hydrogenase nickel incorporation protein HypA/HybF